MEPLGAAAIRHRGGFYLGVSALAAAMIASQVAIMRIFAIGSWAHFGSLVIAIAMAGFGLASAVMCVAPGHFERNAARWASGALLAFGPLLVAGNAGAQALGFNPIFLSASTGQFWVLFGVVGLYFLPFLAAAMFLGSAFLIGASQFGRVYFADLLGAGLAGLLFLAALMVVPPHALLLVPLGLWLAASLGWSRATASLAMGAAALVLGAVAAWAALTTETIATSQYKAVAYARHFPDAQRLYQDWGPQGYVEIYASSYFHFAPGLSDMAAIDLPSMPENAYLGLYIDGDGPIGVMKPLPEAQQGYFKYLPMAMPYLVRPGASAFMVQFGGGLSTRVALGLGAGEVVAAEPNPLIRKAMRDPRVTALAGDLLADSRVRVIPTEGRIAIRNARGAYDVVDLSLVDSTGLSSPGGLSVVEKYAYTEEAMEAYMRALKPDGILSVTVWNKENPPKAVPKLMATMLAAARATDKAPPGKSFLIVQTYLSTATILYRRGGFSPSEVATLEDHARHMAFDLVWAPGQRDGRAADQAVLDAWKDPFPPEADAPTTDASAPGTEAEAPEADAAPKVDMSATALYRAIADGLMAGEEARVAATYGFAMAPVTDERPYLAGYIKPPDIPRALAHFDAISDDWGFLLLWVSLAQSLIVATLLILLPVVFGWRAIFHHQPGKLGLLGYFACLGLGYITVEVTLIAKFVRSLGNPTVSASIMITGMLVLSGIGALWSTRMRDPRRSLPPVLVGVALLLSAYALWLDPVIEAIGGLGDLGRLAAGLAAAGLPALLMGFALPTAMTQLKRLGKEPFFLWAWGVNGLFSVGGAVLAPLIGVLFGLDTALWLSAACYALAVPCFFSVLRPRPGHA